MKKLLALLLAALTVMALVACSPSDSGKDKPTGDAKYTHKILVFQNNLDGVEKKEVAWAAGKDVKYQGYKLSQFLEKNNCPIPADDTVCWFVAGTDKYAANKDYSVVKGELYLAVDDTAGKGRTPITCGDANETGSMPFNCELISLGETAIFMLDVPGTGVGKLSGWLSYMKDAEIEFDVADNYTFTLTDGTTKTVAKADIDTVDLKTVKSVVAG